MSLVVFTLWGNGRGLQACTADALSQCEALARHAPQAPASTLTGILALDQQHCRLYLLTDVPDVCRCYTVPLRNAIRTTMSFRLL